MKNPMVPVAMMVMLFSATLALAAPAKKGADWAGVSVPDAKLLAECRDHLGEFIESPNLKLNSWESLLGTLKPVGAATLLLELDLTRRDLINDYSPILSSIEGLRPFASKGKGLQYYVVVHGSTEALTTLYERFLAAKLPARYQYLDFSMLRAISIFPEMIVALDAGFSEAELQSADQRINDLLEKQKGFSVYDISNGRMIFFYPRTGLPQDIDSDFLKALDIKSSSFRRPPLSMSIWVLNKSENFVKKTAILNSHWVVLSADAYAVIYDLARIVNSELPKVANLDEAFKTVLRTCVASPCPVTPQKVIAAASADAGEPQKLTKNSRKLILELLNRNRGSTKLNDPWGLSRAIVRMEKTISDAEEKQKYKELIRGIPFTKYDYSQLTRANPGPTVEKRFTDFWRAILRARHSQYAELPMVPNNVLNSVREFDDK